MKKDIKVIAATAMAILLALAGILYGIPVYVINKDGQIISSMEMDYLVSDGDIAIIFSLSGAPIPSSISIPGIPRPISISPAPGAK